MQEGWLNDEGESAHIMLPVLVAAALQIGRTKKSATGPPSRQIQGAAAFRSMAEDMASVGDRRWQLAVRRSKAGMDEARPEIGMCVGTSAIRVRARPCAPLRRLRVGWRCMVPADAIA